MKKIYVILVCVAAMFFAVDANAQFGVGVGYNLGTTLTNLDDDSESLNGFYLEATYDWNFIDKSWGVLALQPGVRFSYMGDSESEESMGMKMKASLNETYVDVPVNVKYSYDFGSVKVSAFAGPAVSLGLTSTAKIKMDDGKIVTHNYSGKVVAKGDGVTASGGEGVTDYGRFDIKFGVGAGVTFMDKLNVKLGYNIGMLNRYTGEQVENHKVKYNTNVFYVGLGFLF